jgi:hypothetical protein
MAPPDATPKSLFPGAPAAPAEAAPGAFAKPETLEFPVVDLEEAPMSAFGNRVQADQDADLLDARVSHVREVRYGPGSHLADASSGVPVTPTVARAGAHAWSETAVALLAGSAVGLIVAAVGVSLFLFLTR